MWRRTSSRQWLILFRGIGVIANALGPHDEVRVIGDTFELRPQKDRRFSGAVVDMNAGDSSTSSGSGIPLEWGPSWATAI